MKIVIADRLNLEMFASLKNDFISKLETTMSDEDIDKCMSLSSYEHRMNPEFVKYVLKNGFLKSKLSVIDIDENKKYFISRFTHVTSLPGKDSVNIQEVLYEATFDHRSRYLENIIDNTFSYMI